MTRYNTYYLPFSVGLLCARGFDPYPTLSGEIINWIVQMRKRSLRKVQAPAQGAVSDGVGIQTHDCLIAKSRLVLDAKAWGYRYHIAMAKWRADTSPEIKVVWLDCGRGNVCSPGGKRQVSQVSSPRGETVHPNFPCPLWWLLGEVSFFSYSCCSFSLYCHPGRLYSWRSSERNRLNSQLADFSSMILSYEL